MTTLTAAPFPAPTSKFWPTCWKCTSKAGTALKGTQSQGGGAGAGHSQDSAAAMRQSLRVMRIVSYLYVVKGNPCAHVDLDVAPFSAPTTKFWPTFWKCTSKAGTAHKGTQSQVRGAGAGHSQDSAAALRQSLREMRNVSSTRLSCLRA